MPDDKAQGSVAEAPVKAESAAVAPAEIADKKTPVAASPKQDSAPAENKRDTTASPEKGEVKASDKTEGVVKQDAKAKFEFIKLRQEKKEQKTSAEDLGKQLAEAQKRIKELETTKVEPKSNEDAVSSFLENPDRFLADRDNKVVERVLEAIGQSKREEHFAKAAADAESYLLTRSHVKDPEFAKDVQAAFEKYQHIAQTGDLKAVARNAYLDVCEARGVNPDLGYNNKPDTSAKGSIGVSPSATNSDGPKVWAKGEVQKYLDSAPSIDALKMRLAELEKARNEGRA